MSVDQSPALSEKEILRGGTIEPVRASSSCIAEFDEHITDQPVGAVPHEALSSSDINHHLVIVGLGTAGCCCYAMLQSPAL